MNPHKCGFQETEEWKDGLSNHIHCIRFWLLLLLSHVQNEDKHLTRQMMENTKYLTTKTYSLNKLIQEYKWRGRAIGPNSQHPHPPKQTSLITWSYYFSQLEGLHVPGVPKDGSWKKTKPSGSFTGSWMIIRVPQICPRDAISAGLNQGCQREPCEQHLVLATTSPRAGCSFQTLARPSSFREQKTPRVGLQPVTGLTAQLPPVWEQEPSRGGNRMPQEAAWTWYQPSPSGRKTPKHLER